MQVAVNEEILDLIHLYNAKFGGKVDGPDGELLKLAAVQVKTSLGVGIHEKGIVSSDGTYETSIHWDRGQAAYPKVDSNGTMHDLGSMDGVRLIFGIGTAEAIRLFKLFSKKSGADLICAHRLGNIWIFLFNGVIRHRDRQPASGDGIRVYHQGSSNGGSCFNVIVTLTRDVNKQEAEWIMAHAEKCLGNILTIFSNFCS